MEYKLKDDLTIRSLTSIKTKNTGKLTLKWKCSKKKRHQKTFKKNEIIDVVACEGGWTIGYYLFNGTNFVSV